MKQEQEVLRRIARFLMLQGSFVNNIGLLNGKMGIAIFFFHYAKTTKNKLFEKFGGELIDEIYEQIHKKSPIEFDNGLAGIAWGIKYMLDKQFVAGDVDLILEELDTRIQEWDVRKIKDYSLEKGLKGLAYYVISRYGNRNYRNAIISNGYISDLAYSLMQDKTDQESKSLVEKLKCITRFEEIEISDDLLEGLTKYVRFNQATLFKDDRSLGILNNGLAGIGLNLIWREK